MFVSYAQNGEDIVLRRIFRDVLSGTYVDVGAADPTDSSVTRAFYDQGWSGINVEPVPAYATLLEEERPRDRTFRCAASDKHEDVAFYVADGTGLSTLDQSLIALIREHGYEVEQIPVTTRPLDDILDEAGLHDQPIHFLKVDVEGAEARVLAGLDLSRWRPWVLVVESTKPMSIEQSHEQWEARVLENGYTFCLFDGLNRFYVSNEHPERVGAASYPVCTFDHPYISQEYERFTAPDRSATKDDVVRLTNHRDSLQREVEAREVYVRDVTARIEGLDIELAAATADALRWRGDAIRRRGEVLTASDFVLQAHKSMLEIQAQAAAEHVTSENRNEALEAVFNTVSWRVTRPLRAVRRLGRRRAAAEWKENPPSVDTSKGTPPRRRSPTDLMTSLDDHFVRRFCDRLSIVTNVLDPSWTTKSSSLEQAIVSFERVVDESQASVMTKAWLALVSITGTYPDEPTLEQAARTYRLTAGHGLGELMLGYLEQASRDMLAVDSELEVLKGGVLVDVSHTAAHDLHTGIQRVVREISSRWLSRADVAVVQWNFRTNSVKRLSDDEAERLRNWRDHLHDSGTAVQIRELCEATGKTVIPWGSVLVLPELVANPRTCSGYRALARSGVISRCSLIGYDSVPMTAAETVTDGMTANFGHYLAMVKYSSHLAAISEAAAVEFRAFQQMLQSQGLPGPMVTANPLPTVALEISSVDLESARCDFDVSILPVVVVVGSHEPRKNHLAVLEAAESMWRSGQLFDLIFAGGSSWGGSMFDNYLQELAAQGFPVRVYERVEERSLWALYRLAHFSVFPSLLEGYGLPVAESLASGTPVISSNHGSMAEIGRGGGAVLVDPRDSAALASAMTSLLVDNDLRNRLAGEARARVFPTWDQYSDSLWADLVGTATKSSELL